ncbi:MAG: hypothetical protein V1838_02015 [Patescibacteria group bacterium]
MTIAQDGAISTNIEGRLSEMIAKVRAEGVTALSSQQTKTERVTVQRSIRPTDKHFHLALIQWLERMGYAVIQDRPDLDKKINDLLKDVPAEHQLKQRIISEIPDMNTLEKTYIIMNLTGEIPKKKKK